MTRPGSLRRPALVAVAGLLATSALSACQPPRAGAAAVVGQDRITVDQLHDVVRRSLGDPQAAQRFSDTAAFQRRALTQLIDHDLLQAAATALGVQVSAGDVDARLKQFQDNAGGPDALQKQAAAAGVAPQDLRRAVSDLVLSDAVADKATSSASISQADLQAAYRRSIDDFDQVDSAHILVADEKLARSLLAQVKAAPTRFAALAARFSTDPGSKNQGGELGFNGRGKLVKPFSDAIFSAKPGTFTLAHSEFGWHVIKVEARRTVSLAQATPQLRRQLLSGGRDQALRQALRQQADRMHVAVSPRFGRWDGMQVAAPQDALSSPAPSPDSGGGAAGGPDGSGGQGGAGPNGGAGQDGSAGQNGSTGQNGSAGQNGSGGSGG